MVDSHRSFARAEFAVCLLGTLAIPLPADLLSELFPDATVCTGFGSGHGFGPLILPLVGLWWLRHTRAGSTRRVWTGPGRGALAPRGA
ncbi:MAG TPA: hypothetical protein VIM19_02780 [Actinomycetes bacterium]